VIGTRFIDEHHEIHDYPGDKHDDDDDDHESSEDSDYHHAIYDHVQIDKDDYSDFGDSGELIAAATYRIALSLSTAFEHVALRIGNESAPIQLALSRFPGLAVSNAKILIYFSNKICGSNFIKQHSETVTV